jgi:hypothetical protein
MENLKMTFVGLKGKMTKSEMKKIKGGCGCDPNINSGCGSGGTGSCWRCTDIRGYSSCWYTTSPYTLCIRVYPNTPYILTQVPCTGCNM